MTDFSVQDVVALHNHLQYNFIPPIPHAAEAARKAIDAVNAGDWDMQIETPSGNMMGAAEIVEELRLDYFIDEEQYDWE